MSPLSLLPSFFPVLLLLQPAYAFWVLSHSQLTIDRLDPIVTPGKVAGHVHTVVGASNFGPTVDTQTLTASQCTTAVVQADKSSYWAPQLYYRNENGSLTLIPIVNVNTYYKLNKGEQETISAFPPDLRMIAGDPSRTTYDENDISHKAVNFVCLGVNEDPGTPEFPDVNCPMGLRAQVTFPSCWDGQNVASDDHKSHMAYPEGGDVNAGKCPSTHPNRTITLFHEWIFDVNKFEFKSGQKNWVFSFGDEIGYGFHADFINAWDETVLKSAVEQCTGSFFAADVGGCQPFAESMGEDAAKNCKIDSRVEEDIGRDHPIDVLPGCNPIPVGSNSDCSGVVTPSIKGGGGSDSGDSSTSTSGASTTSNPTSGATSTTDPGGSS